MHVRHLPRQPEGYRVAEQRHVNGGFGRFTMWMLVAAVIVIGDQLTKWAIVEWLPLYDVVPVNTFLNITHHQNYGAAWSLFADAGGWQRWLFTGLASVVSVVIVVWVWRIRNDGFLLLAAGLALVLGGAVGNLIDRIRLGYVTDFIQVYLGDTLGYFPTFNVADAGISVGAAFLIVDSLFFSGRAGGQASKAN